MAVLTNKSDVIANFVRYHGRQPNADELKAGGLIEYLTTKSPQEVESLLSKNSPITGGKTWSEYQAGKNNSSNQNNNTAVNDNSSNASNNTSNVSEVSNITTDQINKAFQAHGFTPNEADLQYWSLKPNTELTKLYENLQKRADDTAKAQAEQQKKQNEEISAGANSESLFEDSSKGALVKFATDPDGSGPLSTSTVFWVNPNTKKIIPIVSAEAFNSFFDTPLDKANIKTITVDYLGTNGTLGSANGFSMVPLSQGINGTASDNDYKIAYDNINTDNLGTHYGKEVLDTDSLKNVLESTDGLFDLISKNQDFGISADVISKIKNDPNQIAFYVNALAYGGYTLADIAKDLKRKQLIKDGDTSLSNVVVISDTKNANDYYNTQAGSVAKSNPALTIPSYLGNVDTSLLNYPIFSLPEDVFKELVPTFDPNSPEGQAEMEKISTAFYDVIQQQLNAGTERDKVLADENYKLIQQDIKDRYGISLSNDATTAWNQLQTVMNNASAAGISGSGMEQETIDKQLQATRKNDMLLRKQQQSEEDSKRAEQLQKYGSPAEIAALSDEEKVKYGFKPSAETAAYFSAENLRELFPTLTDEQLKAYQNSILDENGNYRSDLYQTLYKNTYGTSAGLVVPESGVQPAKKEYQETTAMQNAANAEEKAYKEYTQADPYSKPVVKEPISPVKEIKTPITESKYSNSSDSNTWTTANPNAKKPAVNNNQPIVPTSTPVNSKIKIKNTVTGGIFETTMDDFNKSYDKSKWQLA
jgi:hypothetical protein